MGSPTRFPSDPVEQGTQPQGPAGVDCGDLGDPSGEVGAEVGVAVAVLSGGPMTDTVPEDGLEPVVLVAADVWVGVYDHAGELLADALTHEARLARVDLEALLERQPADLYLKAPGRTLQHLPAGERQVVGVARVGGLNGRCQPGQSAVEPVGAQVGQRGRRRCPLRQVADAIARPR